jgi:hypothetical protein
MTFDEKKSDKNIRRMDEFDRSVKEKMKDGENILEETPENSFTIDDVLPDKVEPVEETGIPEADETPTPEAYDEYINALVMVPAGDGRIEGRVTKRIKDQEGNPIGVRNTNYLFDTRKYEVELSDGTTKEFFANQIAENIFAQCDDEGNHYKLLAEIQDYRKDENAVPKEEGYTTNAYGRKSRKITTKGWELLCTFKEGSSEWIPLKDMKEAYPVEVAEYAYQMKLQDEPAFAWWVKDVIRRRDRIISKVKSRYWAQTHKFGIEFPHSVEEALALDKKNGNDLWRKAIEKEMEKMHGKGTFQRLDSATADEIRKDSRKLPGYKEITCHMVFDIKMDGMLTRKAR